MDPYLEDPDIFPNLHHDLITLLQFALQTTLPPPYFAAVGTRVWVEISGQRIEPDVDVFRPQQTGGKDEGAIAVLPTPAAREVVIEVPEEEFYQAFIDIISGRQEGEKLVTSIEVLSPSNKASSGEGREQYQRKQRAMAETETNLVEIDLLRAGQHTTTVPRQRARAEAGPFDYHVCVRRGTRRGKFSVFPIRMDQTLPTVSIPLLPEEPPVLLDLQAAFDRAYDGGPYRRRIHYGHDRIVPPLTPEQSTWANELLRQKGLLAPPSLPDGRGS
jgi:hypothetical protein